MNEAQRFLRYVTPGFVFFTEIILLLLILFPDWTVSQIKATMREGALGVVFAAILVSGGAGFIFSIVHHFIYWKWTHAGTVNHAELIMRLRRHNLLVLVDANTDQPIPNDILVSRPDAWMIVASLWHERLRTSKYIKSAEPRAQVLSDLVHSTGTSLVASAFAWIMALVIATCLATLSLQLGLVVRFSLASAIGALLLYVQQQNCKRVVSLARGVIEQVLHDALANEKNKPVRTHVMLRN